MEFNEFLKKANEGYKLIPIIKEIESFDRDAIDIYSNHFDEKKSFFFESLEGDKNWSRYTIIGCSSGDFIEISGNKIHRFSNYICEEKIQHSNPIEWLEESFNEFKAFIPENLPSFSGGFVGHFSFESVCFFEDTIKRKEQANDINAPDISLIICKDFIVFDKTSNKVFIVVFSDNSKKGYDDSNEKVSNYEKLLVTDLHPNDHAKAAQKTTVKYDFERDDFISAVKKIKKYISSGDVMQVVLSQRMMIDFPEKPINFYRELRQINPSPYMYYLNMGDYTVVGSSPEILVRLEDKKVTVRPIAGTRPRGKNLKTDNFYMKDLITDKKELSEHLMLLDLGRNDVGKISKIDSVKVTEKFKIEKYSHVMHIVLSLIHI